jgi:hypothetical protein
MIDFKGSHEVEKQFRRLQRPVGRSWRMDETYVRVKGEWKCLYRAVDQEGQTISYGMSSWNTQTGSSQSSGQSSSHSHYNSVGGSHTHASTRGGSTMHAKTRGGSVARATSLSLGEQYSETESETQGMSRGQSWEHGQARSHSESATESKTVIQGRTPSISEEESRSRSVTTAPFYAYRKRRNVISREFLSKDDFLTLGLQKIKALPVGHFVVKVLGKQAVFAQVPFIKEPRITARQLAQARERIFSQECYTRRVEIEQHKPLAVPYIETQKVIDLHGHPNTERAARRPRRPKKAPAP